MGGVKNFVIFASVFGLVNCTFGKVVHQNRNPWLLRNEIEQGDLNCPEPNGQFNHPKYCDQYLNCWDDQPTISYCAHGLVFNELTSSCDYPSRVDCNGKPDSRPKEDMDKECKDYYGTFINPENCGQFVVCQGGKASAFNCPPGLVYDPHLGVCVTPTDPSCLQQGADDDSQANVPDLNPDLIVPVKPTGPGSNKPSDNVILFPVIPGSSWPPMKCPVDISTGKMIPILSKCQSLSF